MIWRTFTEVERLYLLSRMRATCMVKVEPPEMMRPYRTNSKPARVKA